MSSVHLLLVSGFPTFHGKLVEVMKINTIW